MQNKMHQLIIKVCKADIMFDQKYPVMVSEGDYTLHGRYCSVNPAMSYMFVVV